MTPSATPDDARPTGSIDRRGLFGLLALGGAAGAVAAVAGAAAPASAEYRPLRTDDVRIAGLCLRFDDRRNHWPRIHEDTDHVAVGVDRTKGLGGLAVVGNRLRVYLEPDTNGIRRSVVSLIVTPDESMSQIGFDYGGSGGTSVADIVFGRRNGKGRNTIVGPQTPALYGPTNNLWIAVVTVPRPDDAPV